MKYLVIAVCTTVQLLVCASFGHTGARDGKQRWTFAKYRAETNVKRHEPIAVPAKKGDTLGEKELIIEFKADETAEFAIIGDGDAPLSLYVYDSTNKLVAKDVDAAKRGSDICLCEWTPKKDEEFRIIIKNHGKFINVVQAGCN